MLTSGFLQFFFLILISKGGKCQFFPLCGRPCRIHTCLCKESRKKRTNDVKGGEWAKKTITINENEKQDPLSF